MHERPHTMLSGTGRHRRPRQAPAIFVTAGMTGAGIAMPLLGATGAQAADTGTWDRIAQCESGGVWSADTGNGYYGGLQLTQDTWEAYGGTAYAARPDLASRSQQIAIAERILADQGPDAWPACGVSSGLRYDSTGTPPDIDPDNFLPPPAQEPASPSASPSPSDRGADGSGSFAGADSGAGTGAETDPVTGRPESGRPGGGPGVGGAADADPGAGTGRHRGERDARELEQEWRTGGQEASGDERPVDGAGHADRSGRADGAGGPETRTAEDGYRVRPGDSLSAIAEQHALRGGWTSLYETNRQVVGGDPDLILPGQELTLE
ncbi:MAG TPA: transglycosylase family protein [Streptomyces sp.]|nr:transglycosylase family protein [Streptomyces sp.]